MTNYNPSEQEGSDTNGSIADDQYLTTIDGRTTLLEGTPLEEVIQVFADHGLDTWFQITEVRDECQSYEPKAVYKTVEFLKELGVVNEDVDESVHMDDTYANRVLIAKFSESGQDSQQRESPSRTAEGNPQHSEDSRSEDGQ